MGNDTRWRIHRCECYGLNVRGACSIKRLSMHAQSGMSCFTHQCLRDVVHEGVQEAPEEPAGVQRDKALRELGLKAETCY